MKRHHRFEFVPVGQQWRWAITDDGRSSMWWTARLSKDGPKVRLSDGRDARELEASVEIRARDDKLDNETQHGDRVKPVEKQGIITTVGDMITGNAEYILAGSDALWVVLNHISPINFDRILVSIQRAGLPNLTLGFGPEDTLPPKALTGPITMDSSRSYQWDDTDVSGKVIDIEEWEFAQSQSLELPDVPEFKELPAWRAGFSVISPIVINVVAIAIAAAAYEVVTTKFQVIAVSLLLLIYVAVRQSSFILGITLARTELLAVSRYLELRTSIGMPTQSGETEYLRKEQAKFEKRVGNSWVDVVGGIILGLMAVYKLIAVLL